MIYELISENLAHLGGPMGTERTTINYTKYFSKFKFAMDHAEAEYGKSITWHGQNNGVHSGDLGHVMYHINPITVEK